MIEKIIFVVWLHFVGDFIFQSDNMALKKSESFIWLLAHCLTYGIPLLLVGWRFALGNAVLHLFVDFFTSKINKRLFAAGKRHWFFVCIGADQAIHMTCLMWLLK